MLQPRTHSPKLPAKPSISGGNIRADTRGYFCSCWSLGVPSYLVVVNLKDARLCPDRRGRGFAGTPLARGRPLSWYRATAELQYVSVRAMQRFSGTLARFLSQSSAIEGGEALLSFRVSDSARFGTASFPRRSALTGWNGTHLTDTSVYFNCETRVYLRGGFPCLTPKKHWAHVSSLEIRWK